jgi:hypothetical protein
MRGGHRSGAGLADPLRTTRSLRECAGDRGADRSALRRCRLSDLRGGLALGAVERLIDPGARLLEHGDPLALRRSELGEPARRVGAILRQLLTHLADPLRPHLWLLTRLDRYRSFDVGLGEPDRAACGRGRSCTRHRRMVGDVRVACVRVVAGAIVCVGEMRGRVRFAMRRVAVARSARAGGEHEW